MRALSFVLLLVLAACAAGGASSPSIPKAHTGEPVLVVADGDPGDAAMSVAEALAHRPTDDVVAVTGALFVGRDGSVLLCDAIAESFPPQCGGERILVDGLDLASVAFETANGVRWAESVTLLGSVE